MKRLFFIASLLLGLMPCSYAEEYVDLGLPSGTRWQVLDEVQYLTCSQVENYRLRNNIPTSKEWTELSRECDWEWVGNGYRITNKKGGKESLFLPAAGYYPSNNMNRLEKEGEQGHYWVNPYAKEGVRTYSFDMPKNGGIAGIGYCNRQDAFSVILVASPEPHVLCRQYFKWVDLGLPSKTKWGNHTDHLKLQWSVARSNFRYSFPTLEDYQELFRYCKLQYRTNPFPLSVDDILQEDVLVTGPNGNQIYIRGPFLWTSSTGNSDGAYIVCIWGGRIEYKYNVRTEKLNMHSIHHGP